MEKAAGASASTVSKAGSLKLLQPCAHLQAFDPMTPSAVPQPRFPVISTVWRPKSIKWGLPCLPPRIICALTHNSVWRAHSRYSSVFQGQGHRADHLPGLGPPVRLSPASTRSSPTPAVGVPAWVGGLSSLASTFALGCHTHTTLQTTQTERDPLVLFPSLLSVGLHQQGPQIAVRRTKISSLSPRNARWNWSRSRLLEALLDHS